MMVISVAYFARTEELKHCVLNSDELRRETLKRCYSMPGYAKLPLEEKNKIYDKIKEAIK